MQDLAPFLQHPYYSIRFLNYKFTMMGEVNHPGIISIPGRTYKYSGSHCFGRRSDYFMPEGIVF